MEEKRKRKGYFINHYESPCGLGGFKYRCPECGKLNADHGDVWWAQDEIRGGEIFDVECEHCKKKLIAQYDKEEFEVIVS